MTAHIDIPLDQIKEFCQRWKIVEFSLFGSVLRDDFGPDSDVDVLVTFALNPEWSLLDHVRMVNELKELFGRNVDLAQERQLENPFKRRNVLQAKEVIYAA